MSDTKELLRRAASLADGDSEAGEQPDAAMEICHKILADEPDNPSALFVIGCVLLKAARQVQAIQVAKRICSLAPNDPRGWGLQAQAWAEMHRYDESLRCAEKALKVKRTPRTLADMAYTNANAGNWDEADRYCKATLTAAGGDPASNRTAITDALVNQAYADLARGRWVEGFNGFRRTMRTKWRKERVYTAADGGDTAEWMGEPDAVVIVTGEQGLGDEIMAASVVPDAARACKKFILDCDERLAPLFARSFPNVIVSPTRRVDTVSLPILPTHHKTLFGLCELFRKTDDDFPRESFLIPRQDYIGMFRELFGGKKVIGLAWSGGLPRTGQVQRAAGLNAFLPLIRRGEAEFVSLQYKDDAEEVREFEKQHGMRVHRLPWVTQGQDMDLLAALIASLSEVVSVGTAAIHMASAMGVPTTVLVNNGLGWAFAPPEMLWYPKSTNLWRKRPGESWRDCVHRLVEARK